jgi:hypothetical protein
MTIEEFIPDDIEERFEGAYEDSPFYIGRQLFLERQLPENEKSQYLRSMSWAIDHTLDSDPLYRKIMVDAANCHAKVGPRYFFDLSWRAIQANELPLNETYPHGFEEAEVCIKAIKTALQPENIDRFIMNLRRGIPTNKARRGLVFKAVAALNGMEDISAWDFGCSTNQVLKIMALQENKRYRYKPPEVVDINQSGKNAHPRLNPAASEGFARLLERKVHLSFGGGIDIWSPNDPNFMDHVRGSSFYPEELEDRSKDYALYKLMEAEHPEGVEFLGADFLTPLDSFAIKERIPQAPDHVDMVMMSYSMYQLTASQREVALSNAMGLLKADGKLVILDAGSISEKGAITSCDPRLPFRSGVWVYDKAKPSDGFRRYFTVDGGRIRQVHVEPAVRKLAVAKELDLAS